jgi:hypothetical protein
MLCQPDSPRPSSGTALHDSNTASKLDRNLPQLELYDLCSYMLELAASTAAA